MTPQMVHVMGPLKTFGSFNKIAENCLRVYKYHRRILIECLKTFSQDPIEDCYQILDSQNSGNLNSLTVVTFSCLNVI